MGFFDGLAGDILGAGASIYGTWQSSKNTDKALEAQAHENEQTRKYNLELAKMQNQWNIQQWNRENAYNTPAAQKARLESAGLNADMMYGQGGISNTASSAQPMTSGAPAVPMDWSSLANKKTVGAAVMDALAVQQARANVKKTEAEAKSAGVDADIAEKYGLDAALLSNEKLREEINKLAKEAEGIDYSNTLKQLDHDFAIKFRDKIVENKLQRLHTSTGLSANELKEDIETLALRIAGVNAENSRLVRLSNFSTQEMRIAIDVVRMLLGR